MKILLLPVGMLCLLLVSNQSAAEQPGRAMETEMTDYAAAPSESEVFLFTAINRIRSRHGLAPLRQSDRLARIARAHSRDMAQRGVLGHTDGAGRDIEARITAAGIKGWRMIGENVGRSFGRRDNALVMLSIWMESGPHRRNILSRDFDQTGIGTATADDGTLYATQVFMGSTETPPDAR